MEADSSPLSADPDEATTAFSVPGLARLVEIAARAPVATLVVIAWFFALLFTRLPGIESIAILMLVGLPLSLLASVTVLPACAVLTGAQEITHVEHLIP